MEEGLGGILEGRIAYCFGNGGLFIVEKVESPSLEDCLGRQRAIAIYIVGDCRLSASRRLQIANEQKTVD